MGEGITPPTCRKGWRTIRRFGRGQKSEKIRRNLDKAVEEIISERKDLIIFAPLIKEGLLSLVLKRCTERTVKHDTNPLTSPWLPRYCWLADTETDEEGPDGDANDLYRDKKPFDAETDEEDLEKPEKKKKAKAACWETRFQELKEYKRKYGTCKVPQGNGQLGAWVSGQKDYLRKTAGNRTKKATDRYNRLAEIGFWD